MGDLLSRIYDDYDSYVLYCKKVGEKPMRLVPGFLDHWDELKLKYGE